MRISAHSARYWNYQTPNLSATCCTNSNPQPNFRVSSPTYSIELQPDPRLRRIVLLFGRIAMLVGLIGVVVYSYLVWRGDDERESTL